MISVWSAEQKQRVYERVKADYRSHLERHLQTLDLNPSFELSMLPDRRTHGKLRADAFASYQRALNLSMERVEILVARREWLQLLERRFVDERDNYDLIEELEELEEQMARARYGDEKVHEDCGSEQWAFEQVVKVLYEWRRDARHGDFEEEWWLKTFKPSWIRRIAETGDATSAGCDDTADTYARK